MIHTDVPALFVVLDSGDFAGVSRFPLCHGVCVCVCVCVCVRVPAFSALIITLLTHEILFFVCLKLSQRGARSFVCPACSPLVTELRTCITFLTHEPSLSLNTKYLKIFSDSAFSILPGENKILSFEPSRGIECDSTRLQKTLTMSSLYSLLVPR